MNQSLPADMRQWVLAHRPDGVATVDDFSMEVVPVPEIGVDVFFDNVGGELLDEVMGRIRRRARIAICGRISEYLLPVDQYHRHRNLYRIGLQDAKMEGFFVFDHVPHFEEYETQLAEWIRDGRICPLEDIGEGLDRMPEALISLYQGSNAGVRMVRIDPDAERGTTS